MATRPVRCSVLLWGNGRSMSAREKEQRTNNSFSFAPMSDINVHGLRVHLSFPYFHAAVRLQLLSDSVLPLRARENMRCSRERTSRTTLSRSISRRVNFSVDLRWESLGAMKRSLARRLGCPLALMSAASFSVRYSHHRIILFRSISPRVNFSRKFTLSNLIRDGAFTRVYRAEWAGTHVKLTDWWLVDEHQGFEMSKIMKRTKYA